MNKWWFVLPGIIICLTLALHLSPVYAQRETLPSTTLPATTAAPAKETDDTFALKDARGRVIGEMQNPEAAIPLNVRATKASAATAPAKKNLASNIANTVLNLVLVLVVAYLILLGVKRYYYGGQTLALPRANTLNQPIRVMRILETLPIGQGRSLHLVVVGSRCFLMSQSLQQMTLLQEVTDDSVVQELMARTVTAGQSGFTGVLARFMTPHGVGESAEQPADASPMTLTQHIRNRQAAGRGKGEQQ